ncbi:hypothetical protein ADL28_31295 [Streptomyces violaceusniger]|uniref:Uncharacterized protein n=1 Tax=Streptomyces violaceusniger TaxID=68280 RepID=A0A0X3VSW4_STRVO|nr:hypothetical protein ADL28_31295 [Streptomyces violaceusniger]
MGLDLHQAGTAGARRRVSVVTGRPAAPAAADSSAKDLLPFTRSNHLVSPASSAAPGTRSAA